jgi:hypothetical protein
MQYPGSTTALQKENWALSAQPASARLGLSPSCIGCKKLVFLWGVPRNR